MKTFTTYAEKKAKQFLNLLQGYTKGIRFTAILILLLMGVNNAWAASEGSSWYDWASSENVYFDNTNSSYTNVSMLIGRQWNYGSDGVGSSGVNFTKVANTNNLYHAATTWNKYNTLLFIDAKDWGWEGNKVTQRYTYADNYTNTNNININGTELFYAASSTKGATLNHQDLSGYAALNSQQTIQSVVDGTVANSKATISITSYKMTAHKTTTEQTATLGTGTDVSYITAARTATTTLTVGTVATGYQFDGWYAAETGGTALSTSTTYTYYPTAATTVYARFSTKQHTVLFGVHSSGHGSLTAKVGSTSISSDSKVNYGSTIEFTAKPDPGYQIEGWYKDSNCTTSLGNGTNNTYTVTVTTGTNVHVKFEAIPVNSHNITYTTQGTGWTYGNSNPTTAEEGATVTFVVNPTAGYRVSVSSDGPALTGPNANNQYTFTMPTKDVKITVDAKPEQYTVTLDKRSGTGGTSSVTATYAAAMPSITKPTRTGYTFNGYYDATSGGTKYYNADGSSAKNWDKTSNTTLYARWTAKQYTITYKDQNNATFSGTHANGYPTKHTYGTATTLKTATKTGYTFDGWFTTSACTGTAVTSLGATDYTSNITLYAKWTELPPTTIYIKSDGSYADFKWNYNSVAYDMEKVDCDGTYYTADILGGVREITLTGSNNFTTTTLTVPTDDKKLYDLTSTTHLYLKPNSNWKADGARFAAAFLNNDKSTTEWVSMDSHDADTYKCAIPDGTWKYVIFCRMNGSKPENNWDNKWNQTGDLTIPTDGKNLFDKPNGTWDGATTSWSAIYDNNRWTTFEAPTLNVQVNITGKGSIVIDGETYTSITTGTETFAFTKASGENIAVGAITPADRWAYNNDAQITMCDETIDLAASHTINGPATINLSFTQTKCEVVFNLGIPKGVPIPNWTINNQYIAPRDTVVKPTVGEINGYLFGGWYTTGEYSDATLYNFGTPVTKDIVLHARWVRYEECIFFKNNLNWDKIYVYTFTGDVWGDKGVTPKNNRNNFGQMTRIGLSDVYYYILKDLNGFSHIAFSDYDMSNYNEFYEHNAIYRADRQDKMQLFIPERDQTAEKTNKTSYFSSGIWMKYNSTESGYKWSSDKNSWNTDNNPFTAPITGGYTFTVKVSLSGNTTYQFKINNVNGDWYSEPRTMTQDDCTNWWFKPESDPNKNAKIEPNVTGEYLFTISLGDGKVMVSLEYPLSVGDYRLAYQDNTDDSFHPGHYIRKRSTGTYRDTTSFFVFHDKAPVILLQECTAIDPATGTATWETDNTDSVSVEATSVYNFVLQQTDSRAELLTDATHLYTGEFYIRTDAAEGGWDYFRQTANLMNFSTYASDHEHFTHYFCRWITANKNVKFTIGNDYSLCISDTLDGDDLIRKENVAEGSLPVDANVRFTWDNRNNTITRAYIAGSAWTRDRFLVLQGNDQLKDTLGNAFIEGELESDRDGLHANEVMFTDLGNWIYQTDVNVNAQTLIRLIATYNESVQYFKGSEAKPINLLSTTASKDYKVRLIYDFKTNHLVVAWLAGGNTVDGEDQELGADMMIIRHNQNGAEQLQFNPNSNTLSGVGTGYAVMTFDKYFLNNLDEEGNELPEKKSQYERAFYWVSFPFDVKLRDVFGFGEYGQHWIMEYYDGAARAANGYWIDSDTYWKYITNLDYILKAGQGYVLCLNLNKMGTSSTVFTNTSEVSLYFPSTSPLQTITGAVTTAIVPEHKCTIERDYRYIYDSNWNLIGVPGYKDIASVGVGGSAHEGLEDPNVTEECINFYYRYIPADDKYEATNNPQTNNFQTMFAYMVQYAGTVEWSAPEFVKGIAARRIGDMPSEYTLRLELYQSDASADQTIVKLKEQDATADFDLNVDMTKIFNSGLNIYTLTGTQNIQVAGNALPMAKTTVPVGVRIATAGEYTFRMPDGTDGINVILVDNQTGAHTDMLYDEYTVTLDAGTFENRFYLIVDPDRAATSVENVGNDAQGDDLNGNDATGVKKYIIDGHLIIRTADAVYDAQGQRL